MENTEAAKNHKSAKIRMLNYYQPIINNAISAHIEGLGRELAKPASQNVTINILALCELITELRSAANQLEDRLVTAKRPSF